MEEEKNKALILYYYTVTLQSTDKENVTQPKMAVFSMLTKEEQQSQFFSGLLTQWTFTVSTAKDVIQVW